ncbi:MAG TPA: hypothetical protein V6D14_33820 [Coleofasciculaceae cyanobacterium]
MPAGKLSNQRRDRSSLQIVIWLLQVCAINRKRSPLGSLHLAAYLQ